MASPEMPTQFAPAARAPAFVVRSQAEYLATTERLQELYDAVTEIVLILNKERQIVFVNRRCLELLGAADPEELYGLRPGEALQCLHAYETEGGCGTTEFCAKCGAVNAILACRRGSPDSQECRIVKANGDALELLVRATPASFGFEEYIIFALTDISHEKRRRALERIFLHDLMNTVLSQKLLSELLMDGKPQASVDIIRMIRSATMDLEKEIESQRDLVAAENNELVVRAAPLTSMSLLRDLANAYQRYGAIRKCDLRIDPRARNVFFRSDKVILSRVLGNMIKNAVEASDAGDAVTLDCGEDGCGVSFRVHNPVFMPKEVQLQLFQRSFSTRGTGRGLGTYSMKLLSEKFLKGKVAFTTSERTGTTFVAWCPLDMDAEEDAEREASNQ